jgi:hypothetical protein
MGRIVVTEYISLDGVMEAPTGDRAPSVQGLCPGLKLGSGWPMSNAAMPGQQ